MTLLFAGLGLDGVNGITLQALRAIRQSDLVLLDTYTSRVSEGLRRELEKGSGREIVEAGRRLLEEQQRNVVEKARSTDVVVLVPGDPFAATTHVSLRLLAARMGVRSLVLHGVSIFSSAPGACGLQSYKFGRTVTIPKTEDLDLVQSAYRGIKENLARGLHTLALLDTKGGGLSIQDALQMLLDLEGRKRRGVMRPDMLTVGLARVGCDDVRVAAGTLEEVRLQTFPPPPHCLVFPGDLHFAEEEALVLIAGAPEGVVRGHRARDEVAERASRYFDKAGAVLRNVGLRDLPVLLGREAVERVTAQASNYVEDTKNFLAAGDAETALASVSYSEGLLDALRLLGLASFSW